MIAALKRVVIGIAMTAAILSAGIGMLHGTQAQHIQKACFPGESGGGCPSKVLKS